MPRHLLLQFQSDLGLPLSIEVNAKGEQALKVIIESLIAQGMAYVPSNGNEHITIDDTNLQTVNIVYKDFNEPSVSRVPPGAWVVVNPEERPMLDALLESATVIPGNGFQQEGISTGHDQTIRLTVGEGVQDPEAGRVYDRYFKALQAQDYDALFDIYDPNITMTSVVDENGRWSFIEGRDAVMANQKTRWKYWLERYGPLSHHFLTTHISTHTAQLRFQFASTGIEWASMYTMADYKITSIRHQRDLSNDARVANVEWTNTFYQ